MQRHQYLLKGAVDNIKKLVDSINDVAPENQKLNADSDLKEIHAYLTHLIDESEIDTPESISRTIRKLKRLRVHATDDNKTVIACPCCLREMDDNTASIFNASMESLANLENSRLILQDKMKNDDLLNYLIALKKWRTQGNYLSRYCYHASDKLYFLYSRPNSF